MNIQTDRNLLSNIIDKDEKIVYLVGAGISMNPPSSLPSATQFSRILLGYCTPQEEVTTLLSQPELRYELVVERIQINCDENLDFLNYLELITNPNIIHFYLGSEIINRHPVITTNFDFLIEHALKKILPESQHEKIFPIITKQDYLENKDYHEIYEKDKFPLYKIHGSKKNLITGENTTPSLITTLSSLGKNRGEGETFAIEPFKKDLVHNLLDGGTLIVMGYSGNDVFDIGPLLENFPTLKRMIWIDHDINKEMAIQEILPSNELDSKEISTCDRFLLNIRNSNPYKIYHIKTNTAEFVSNFLWSQLLKEDPLKINLNITQESKQIDFKTWVEPILTGTKELRKYNIAIKLYTELGNFEKAMECAQKGLQLAEDEGDQEFKAIYLSDIGLFNSDKGNYDEALKLIEESLEISKKRNNRFAIGRGLNSLGSIYNRKGDLQKALEFLEEAKDIFEEVQKLSNLADTLTNIGTIYDNLDEIEKSLDHYEAALSLEEKIGNLRGKATLLNNIGSLYDMKLNDSDKALTYYQETLKLNEVLGNLPGQALNLANIAMVYSHKKMYSQAYDLCLKSLKIFTELGDLDRISGVYANLGCLKEDEGNIEEAIDWTIKSLKILDKLGNNIRKCESQNLLGRLYYKKNDLNSALPIFKDAFNSAKEANHVILMISSLCELADVYNGLGEFIDAISTYSRALKLAKDIGDKKESASILEAIGLILIENSKFSEAVNIFVDLMKIYQELKDFYGLQITLGSLSYCSVALGDYSNAKIFCEKALELAKKLNSQEDIQVLQENLEFINGKLDEQA